MLAGGGDAARERVGALAAAFAGRGVWELGGDASAANALKLIGKGGRGLGGGGWDGACVLVGGWVDGWLLCRRGCVGRGGGGLP